MDRLRSKGWVLAYIGANQDAVEVARDLHIPNALNYEATPTGTAFLACSIVKAHRKATKLFDLPISEKELGCMDTLFDEDEKQN